MSTDTLGTGEIVTKTSSNGRSRAVTPSSRVSGRLSRIVGTIGLAFGLLVVIGLILRSGPPERLEANVDVRHRCSVTDGYMTATGTVRNRLSKPHSVRLVWTATSTADFDPPIRRGYTVNLGPDEIVEFEHLVVSVDSIANNVMVDDDYNCSLTVEPPSD